MRVRYHFTDRTHAWLRAAGFSAQQLEDGSFLEWQDSRSATFSMRSRRWRRREMVLHARVEMIRRSRIAHVAEEVFVDVLRDGDPVENAWTPIALSSRMRRLDNET